jgi:hypothetical protein
MAGRYRPARLLSTRFGATKTWLFDHDHARSLVAHPICQCIHVLVGGDARPDSDIDLAVEGLPRAA